MEEQSYKTLPEQFAKAVQSGGDQPAYHEMVDGSWKKTSFHELQARAQNVARYLIDQGIEAGDRAALISTNAVEWPVVDMGMQLAAVVNVPIYPSSSPEQILYILKNSRCRLVFAQDPKQLEKLRQIRDQYPVMQDIVVLRPGTAELKDKERSLRALEDEFGKKTELDSEVTKRIEGIDLEDVASIVYTSGTTGDPKGVMLTHKNFAHNIQAAKYLIELGPSDHHLSFLPLSHVLERTVGYYVPLFSNAQVHFAESQDKLVKNIQEIRPTFMTSVPRLYEKMRDGIIAKANKAGGFKKSIFEWAVEVGKLRAAEIQGKGSPGLMGRASLKIADSLVFDTIRKGLGGRLRFFVSGGAPLAADLGEFFLGANIKILEGYGLTETTPLIAANTDKKIRIGTVGEAVWKVEVKIAEDGEILARGDNVMKGYFENEEATKEAVDAEGWFHTGDIGEFTEEGCLRITDRKKNLLVMSNGKNVAPAPIESKMINSPFVAQSVVIGDCRKFIAALVTPDYEALLTHAKQELNLSQATRENLVTLPEVVEFMTKEVQRVCDGFNPYEVPKKVALLPQELTEAAGELTPTLKVKRKVVLENHKDLVEKLYGA